MQNTCRSLAEPLLYKVFLLQSSVTLSKNLNLNLSSVTDLRRQLGSPKTEEGGKNGDAAAEP